MARSGSNLSIFRENNRKPVTRSRQNTLGGLDFGEDHVRNIGSDYQEIQIRTLTKWINAQLQQENDRIENIRTDLKDGKRLLKLLSVVSKDTSLKPEKMNMRIHQVTNVGKALGFLEKQFGSDNIPDIANEAIVDCDLKKTLALVFFIMIKYQIQLILNEHGEDFIQSLSVSFSLLLDLKLIFFFLRRCHRLRMGKQCSQLILWIPTQMQSQPLARLLPPVNLEATIQ